MTAVVVPWAAAVIVGGIVLVVGAIITLIAYNRLKTVSFVPHETIQSVREDQEWLGKQKP